MFKQDKQNFAVGVPHYTLARFMAHYEIYKLVKDQPGVVIDIGVGAGGSTWAFAAMGSVFAKPKAVYGFDTFAGFPAVGKEDACASMAKVGQMAFPDAFKDVRLPEHINLYKGDIAVTVPEFVRARSGMQIALLNLDADLYAPTRTALECLEPRVVPGGVIIFDEYDLKDVFPGERKAVDEYYTARIGRAPRVHRIPWCSNPSAYLVKGEE